MKAIYSVIVLVLICCRGESTLSIDPNKLIGTWISNPANGPDHLRWTFDVSILYIVQDSTAVCDPAQGQPWEYQVDKSTLIAHYVGISNGLVPMPDMRFLIITLSDSTLIIERVDSDRQQFKKCR